MVVDEESMEQFPIGNALSWEQIASTMASNPQLLMSEWVWDERWNTRSTANCLFVQFTTDYFLTLSQDILRNSKPPKPKDLKGAMELWILRSLMTLLIDVSFMPSNHGLLRNVPGRRNTSFGAPSQPIGQIMPQNKIWGIPSSCIVRLGSGRLRYVISW